MRVDLRKKEMTLRGQQIAEETASRASRAESDPMLPIKISET